MSISTDDEYLKLTKRLASIYGPQVHGLALRMVLLDAKDKGFALDFDSIAVSLEKALQPPEEKTEQTHDDSPQMM